MALMVSDRMAVVLTTPVNGYDLCFVLGFSTAWSDMDPTDA